MAVSLGEIWAREEQTFLAQHGLEVRPANHVQPGDEIALYGQTGGGSEYEITLSDCVASVDIEDKADETLRITLDTGTSIILHRDEEVGVYA